MSSASDKQYLSMLNQLTKVIGEDVNEQSLTTKWPQVVGWIELKESIATRKNYYSFIKKITKDWDNKTVFNNANDRFSLYRCAQMDACSSQEPTEKEKQGILTRDELNERLEYIKGKVPEYLLNYQNGGNPQITPSYEDYRKLLKYLVLMFHIETPIRNDLANTKIFYDNEYTQAQLTALLEELISSGQNFICIVHGNKRQILCPSFLSLGTYKTAGKYQTKRIVLPEDIVNEFKRYHDTIKKFSVDNYWIVNNNGEKMSPNNFSKFFNTIFDGSKIGTTMLRKSAVTALHQPEGGKLKKQIELADKMGHSLSTAQMYYSKILK